MPFCSGNPGYHLGYNLAQGTWSCWRCGGGKRLWDVLVALLGSNALASKAYQEFRGHDFRHTRERKQIAREVELPCGLQPLTDRAKKYLERRNFDPDMLEAFWRLQSTGCVGRHKFRIFIPIFLHGQLVSWQCRDITGRSRLRYIGQSRDREIISNKQTLYGIDAVPGKSCVVVEGVADVWRLGPGAVATFGIKYRPEQISMLVKRFATLHILYDPPDPQAQIQAAKLGMILSAHGKDVTVWSAETDLDPGDFSQDDADSFMRDAIGFSGY